MLKNSPNIGTHTVTMKSDPRVLPVGKVLRRTKINELPQLFNILIGNMHLVGPRAEWFKLSDKYIENITHYGLRHIVKPGITGWAQIIYPYGFDENSFGNKNCFGNTSKIY